jgi:hypothetical protein
MRASSEEAFELGEEELTADEVEDFAVAEVDAVDPAPAPTEFALAADESGFAPDAPALAAPKLAPLGLAAPLLPDDSAASLAGDGDDELVPDRQAAPVARTRLSAR